MIESQGRHELKHYMIFSEKIYKTCYDGCINVDKRYHLTK